MEQDPNHAAKDLWSQMFARAAEHPGAALMDPEYDPAEDRAAARGAFLAAGWSEQQIDAIEAASARRNALAPATSPGVNPASEAFHAALCDDIEAEMARQGLVTQERVARGIEPRTGPFAYKAGVVMTDESIITVGTFTYRFCGILAKAFIRTLNLNPWMWQPDSYDAAAAGLLLRRSPQTMLYWHRTFMSFAMTGTHINVPFEPANQNEIWLVEQVARAMELFIVGHEYGHHHLGHGRDIEADARSEEFAADQFALRLMKPIGERDRTPIWNPYLASGAGGAILLKALETLRRFEIALGGRAPQGDTHPPPAERIARFDSVALLVPDEFRTLKGFRTASVRIMDAVDALMAEMISVMPKDARAKLAAMRAEIRSELPES